VHVEARAAGVAWTFLFGVLAIALVVLVIFQPPSDALSQGEEPEEVVTWAPAVAAPVQAASPGSGIAELVDPDWAKVTATSTGIPERAVRAYAGAAIMKANTTALCHLSWNTLAAIGAIESDHGRHDGSVVSDDGTVSPAIYGIALDGEVTELIADSDGGEIDGDASIDRAVGPMQLIPQTWRNWHTDGNADGVEDPQNLDDSVMAAANYLCRASTALDTEQGWRNAVLAYNGSESYLEAVARTAAGYAEAVEGSPGASAAP
jgi:membrane-bound lytic murein transglycosylase B